MNNQLVTLTLILIFVGVSAPYCPPVFDGLICWKATPANETAYESCPDFIDGYEVDRKYLKQRQLNNHESGKQFFK